MKTKSLLIVTTIGLLSSHINFGQAPNLGTAANYILFSSVGAIGNTGISQITGNVGTNVGAISGFGNVNGVIHNADAATLQCSTDLHTAYTQLNAAVTTAIHAPVLGNGETLFAGVYSIAAAGSLVSILNLDAQGNPNAVFIIRTGGAFTTAASSSVNLINGAMACNVFWRAEGAISMATFTIMKGTLIANGGAIDMGDGGSIEGRALSLTGAVSVYGTLAYIPKGCSRPILTGPLAPMLGTLECYALFSSNGAVSNSGVTNVTGDVGTNNGSTSGFNQALVTGTVHPSPDASTAQGATDFPNLYNYLDTLSYDIELMYPAQFGNNLVLTPHTYRMNAAAVFTDILYLNAEGNANAIFVIQINGALSTNANSEVRLINGTQARNVYWKVDGATTINDNSIFNGTIVCNNSAIVLNSGVTLNGRALTTANTINTTAITASNPFGGSCAMVLPIKLLSFTGVCDRQNVVLKWETATETKNHSFILERNSEGINWEVIGTVETTDNRFFQHAYTYTDRVFRKTNSNYRLKQTDINGNFKYGVVVSVKKCGSELAENLTLYPNPSAGKFHLLFTGDKGQVYSTGIFNALGEKVYTSTGFQSKFDLSNKTQGVYFVQIHLRSKIIHRQIVLVQK